MTLLRLRRDPAITIAALLTTVTEGYDRVSMHGVRRSLLERQAAALDIPLHLVTIPPSASNQEYEDRMEAALEVYSSQGITTVAFGDLFLAGIRAYRETWLSRIGVRPIFPIWHEDTSALAQTFMALGFRAVATCVDGRLLSRRFAGQLFDRSFLSSLPASVDPCGENGEFHTFVFAGPLFLNRVGFAIGEVVPRESWHFCDLVPT